MQTAILVDYANLYHNILNDPSRAGDANEGAAAALAALDRYLTTYNIRCLHETEFTARHAFLLNEERFCAAIPALEQLGFKATVVQHRRKTLDEAALNLSADDDGELIGVAMGLCPSVDAFVLVSNDGDFLSLVEKARHQGRFVVVAAYETGKSRLSGTLRRAADEVLPLRDILLDKPEPEPLSDRDPAEPEPAPPGPALEIYHGGKSILAFPLERQEVEVGRRSIRLAHFPHIDLTDYDVDKAISRKHLCVATVSPGRYLLQVHTECSRPTWLAGQPLFPGESILLDNGDKVVLGGSQGFGVIVHSPHPSVPTEVEESLRCSSN